MLVVDSQCDADRGWIASWAWSGAIGADDSFLSKTHALTSSGVTRETAIPYLPALATLPARWMKSFGVDG